MKTNLTTEKILDKKFEKDVKGYNALEVDKFLDLIIADYKVLLGEISKLKDEVFSLKRENETLKVDIRDKETVISIEKSKLAVLEKNKNYSAEQLDPIDLLQRCGKYEVKLSELGVDPSKIK